MSLRRSSDPVPEPPTVGLHRKPSASITDHYSMLRSNSNTEASPFTEDTEQPLNTDPITKESNTATSPSTSSVTPPIPHSPKLIPVKKALSIVSKLPSPSTSPIQDGLRHLLRKTNLGIFLDNKTPPTDGPMTKSFDDLSISPNLAAIAIDDPISADALALASTTNDNTITTDQLSEIVLESPKIPEILIKGIPLLRISRKKKVQRTFRVDLDRALVTWNNKSTSKMSLDNIQQIRVGDDARNYREEFGVSKNLEDLWATILYNDLYSNKLKAMHIIAPTKEDFDLFIGTLTKLVSQRRALMKYLSVPGENFAHIHWKNYVAKDSSNKELLTLDDVLKLTKRLHINCDVKYLSQIFKTIDTEKKGALNFPDFQKFVKTLKVRPEVISIFEEVSQGNENIPIDTFTRFLKNVQKQDESGETIANLFNKFSQDGVMDIEGFTNYLTSSYASHTKATQEDFTHPLSEYFISSSHNTYLLGKQYGGSSPSVEGYTKALQRGCRSIEIDIWDGDSGPVVSHGKITSAISVRDVLKTIRKYAFIVTPFPLFISLDVNCKAENQLILRDLILEVFGEMVITKPLLPNPFRLPSPLDLKHKVLIKVKKSSQDHATGNQNASNSGSFTSSSTAADDGTDDEISISSKSTKKDKKSLRIIPQLSELGVYASGIKFTNFALPESKTVNHIFSFSDRIFTSMIRDIDKDYLMQKHNRRYLTRVYPASYRYKSSNFLPIIPWYYGVQMVATNWQTYDLGQQLNEAMFHVGSKNGYVLKPPILRDQAPHMKFKDIPLSPELQVKFSVEIISGQLLPRPKEMKSDETLSPYVVFELIEANMTTPLKVTDLQTGQHFMSSNTSCSTKPIPMNGFNPLWNYRIEGTFKDFKSFNFIRFVVKTGELPFALNCCKLDNLNQGYRHLPLYDLQGEEYIFSTLFVKVNYELFNPSSP